jgi:hypothetical protein
MLLIKSVEIWTNPALDKSGMASLCGMVGKLNLGRNEQGTKVIR